ncbi:hypothetical protein GQR58_001866 [Nymphon striatum]|nr:hypothetical protein GQR58_001866 [Nymphon striatum]
MFLAPKRLASNRPNRPLNNWLSLIIGFVYNYDFSPFEDTLYIPFNIVEVFLYLGMATIHQRSKQFNPFRFEHITEKSTEVKMKMFIFLRVVILMFCRYCGAVRRHLEDTDVNRAI